MYSCILEWLWECFELVCLVLSNDIVSEGSVTRPQTVMGHPHCAISSVGFSLIIAYLSVITYHVRINISFFLASSPHTMCYVIDTLHATVHTYMCWPQCSCMLHTHPVIIVLQKIPCLLYMNVVHLVVCHFDVVESVSPKHAEFLP